MDLAIIWQQLRHLWDEFLRWLPGAAAGLVLVGLFYILTLGIKNLVIRATYQRQRQRNLGLALGRLAQIVVILLGLLVALSVVLPTFNPGDLIQLLGISSVAFGFAFRDILQNFLAGILLLLGEPFRMGDQIVVDKYEGTVENIETRGTTLKTYDGRRIVIPNADLLTRSVIVNTAFDKLRLEYDIGIGYEEDIKQVEALILAALGELSSVLVVPPAEVLVVELGDWSVKLRVRWWISPPRRTDVFAARDEALALLKSRLMANNVAMPFPTQQLLITAQPHDDGSAPVAFASQHE